MKEFNQKEDMFYCLQPLVIRKYEDGYEVIDGQQRLTTIALIHAYLEEESFQLLMQQDQIVRSLFKI